MQFTLILVTIIINFVLLLVMNGKSDGRCSIARSMIIVQLGCYLIAIAYKDSSVLLLDFYVRIYINYYALILTTGMHDIVEYP